MNYKKTKAWEAFSLFWKKPKKLSLVLLFDVLFFAALLLFSEITTSIAQIYPIITNPGLEGLIFVLFYLLLLALLYSFFKFLALSALFGMHKKKVYDFSLVKWLFVLNLIIAVAFILVILILAGIIFALNTIFRETFLIIILVIVLFVFYILTNILQILLYKVRDIKGLIKHLKKLDKKWKLIIPLNICFALGFWFLYTFFSSISGKIVFNMTAAIVASIVFAVLLFIYIYLVHLFNRVYLYMVVR